MQINEYGNRAPKLNRVLISGAALSGKTVTAAKFAEHPKRVFFISTDGNAIRQGYRGIHFPFPTNANQMMPTIIQALQIAEQDGANWDTLVIDLIEDFDERMQTLLRADLEGRQALKAWGKITAFFKDFQTLLMTRFSEKTVILLSREIAIEEKNKYGDVIKTTYIPALRETLRNQILKDQDAEIRLLFDDKGNRQVDTGKQRYVEISRQLSDILSKPLPDFSKPVELTPEQLKEKIGTLIVKAESLATKRLGQETTIEEDVAKEILLSETFEQASERVGIWAKEKGL